LVRDREVGAVADVDDEDDEEAMFYEWLYPQYVLRRRVMISP
jgi:hypothetical protein